MGRYRGQIRRIDKTGKNNRDIDERIMRGKADKMDYKIWKYRKGRSIKRLFELSDIGFQFLGIAVIILSVIAMAVLEIVVRENVENKTVLEFLRWGIAIAIIAVPTLYFFFASRMSARVSSMKLTFARDGSGCLYVFDYGSAAMQNYAAGCGMAQKQIISGNALNLAVGNWKNSRNMSRFIELIDKNQMIEGLLEQKRMLAYGRQVVLVRLIEEKGRICRLYCILQNREGRKEHKELVLSKSYEDYENLIREFRKLEDPLSKDSIKYCPFCGNMLVRDFCPKCQSGSLPHDATKGDKWRKWDPKLKIANRVLYVLALLFLIGCIAVRVYSETSVEYSYEEVTAIVAECRESSYKGHTKTEVTVIYNDQKYDLINVKSNYPPYIKGFVTQAYFCDGKMYANVDGVKSNSIWGKRYFWLLGSAMVLGFAGVALTSVRKSMKMKE